MSKEERMVENFIVQQNLCLDKQEIVMDLDKNEEMER